MRNELHRNQVTDTQTSGENLRDAVYHEAGHLVVAQFFGLTIREVEIEEDGSGRANISSLGRPCRSSAGPSGHTNSPHPSSREGHHYHRLVEFELPPMTFDLSRLSCCCGCLSVQRNSVPSTQMRCMITASRRASASARGAWSSLP
jgi:hypothetical protein